MIEQTSHDTCPSVGIALCKAERVRGMVVESEISQGQSGFSSQLFNRSRHFWSEVSPMDSA